jgi:hypothetical protein
LDLTVEIEGIVTKVRTKLLRKLAQDSMGKKRFRRAIVARNL